MFKATRPTSQFRPHNGQQICVVYLHTKLPYKNRPTDHRFHDKSPSPSSRPPPSSHPHSCPLAPSKQRAKHIPAHITICRRPPVVASRCPRPLFIHIKSSPRSPSSCDCGVVAWWWGRTNEQKFLFSSLHPIFGGFRSLSLASSIISYTIYTSYLVCLSRCRSRRRRLLCRSHCSCCCCCLSSSLAMPSHTIPSPNSSHLPPGSQFNAREYYYMANRATGRPQ